MIDPLFDLTGKVALVTGGSRGLGREIAMAYAARGAVVAVASRKLENCEKVVEDICHTGGLATAHAAHVGRWDQIDRLIDEVYAAHGAIDVLVNNAGMGPALPSHEVSEALFDSVLNLNFKGPFRLASQIGKRMHDGEGGAIINISSVASLQPTPCVVPYGAAKAALNAMTSSLAREYGPNVRVNTIAAGPFLTDIAKAWPPEAHERADNAVGRPGRPEEIVTAALFLASSRSSYVTGALLRVDGGN